MRGRDPRIHHSSRKTGMAGTSPANDEGCGRRYGVTEKLWEMADVLDMIDRF
jgi:hypothetical protein